MRTFYYSKSCRVRIRVVNKTITKWCTEKERERSRNDRATLILRLVYGLTG